MSAVRLPRLLAPVAVLVLSSCGRGPEPGALAGWNVLLVTIDTLGATRVGFMGYESAETPAMDDLARRGVVFEDAVSAAPVTLPSHATILTGRWPPSHGALDNGIYALPDTIPTLATVLRDAGYATGAVVGAYVLHGRFGLDVGFDWYEDQFRRPRQGATPHGERRAGVVTERALEWLRTVPKDRPFFLWVHYYDPHAPYDPPPPWKTRFAANPYDGEVAAVDEAIGELMGGIAAIGRTGRTLVVVTADHGEGFGDGGEMTHGLLLRRSTLHVPLLLTAPDALPAGARIDGCVSTADIAPTVLRLLGVSPPGPLDGTSLLPAVRRRRAEGRHAYSETRLGADTFGWSMLARIRDDRWARVRGPIPELYDLETDPTESTNLAGTRPLIARELDRLIDGILAGRAEAARNVLGQEDLEALRALGYVLAEETPAPTGADPKTKITVWNRVNELRDLAAAGAHAEVVSLAEAVLAEDPGNGEARVRLGEALVASGRIDEGLRELRALFEASWMVGRSGTAYARALARAGRTEQSVAVLRILCRQEPRDVDHPYNLANVLAGTGRLREAREAYEEALRLNPVAIHVLSNFALALSRPPDPDATRAVDLVDRAIVLSTEDDRPLLMKAEVLRNVGREDEARDLLRDLARRPVLHGISRADVTTAMGAGS